jgi:hypothetical protein
MTQLNQLIAIERQQDLIRAASDRRAAQLADGPPTRVPRLRRRRSADAGPDVAVPQVKVCPPAA